jgi:hypothetical protein
METKTFKGKWWLPENPDHRVMGTLTFVGDDDPKLELEDSLNPDTTPIKEMKRLLDPFVTYEIIQGISIEGIPLTLLNCEGQRNSINLMGYDAIPYTIFAQWAFIGHHFQNVDDIAFQHMTISYDHLHKWTGFCSIEHKRDSAGQGEITYTNLSEHEAVVQDIQVSLHNKCEFTSDSQKIEVREDSYVLLTSKQPLPILEFLRYCNHIQSFFALGTGNPIQQTSMKGKILLEDQYPVSILHAPWHAKKRSNRTFKHPMLFTFRDIADSWGKFLAKWVDLSEKIKPVYNLFLSNLYAPRIYEENRFLFFMQSLETYHRRMYGGAYLDNDQFQKVLEALETRLNEPDLAIPKDIRDVYKQRLRYMNEYSLRKRLNQILDMLGDITTTIIPDTKGFTDSVVRTRNYLTHYSEENADNVDVSGQNLYVLGQKLRSLLELCLLHEIGFSQTQLQKVAERITMIRRW